MACFVYEGVLLFGIVMAAGLVYAVATRQTHALAGSQGLQAFLFVVLALYFVFCWSRSGQTLAMQTWHIRLLTADGQRVRPLRALMRYLLSWMWFMPALLALHFSGLRSTGAILAALLAGVLAYAALVRLHPDRQYWHDAVCRTRLAHSPPPPRPGKT
jgi:uncharacterized RDD family membrane protein YckC